MLIMAVRTDKPKAELLLYEDAQLLGRMSWLADRTLTATIHLKIKQLLADAGKELAKLDGIVCFAGPGSFTGLRIGASVANTLAHGLGVPIVSGKGRAWSDDGVGALISGENARLVQPNYG